MGDGGHLLCLLELASAFVAAATAGSLDLHSPELVLVLAPS